MGSDDIFGAAGLAFGVLGPLRVLCCGEPVVLGGRRQRAVLARLLVEPDRVVSRSALVEAVWGESAPREHAATLQSYVFHLREALEPSRARGAAAKVLVTESGGYRLAAVDGQVDSGRFERLLADGQALSAGGDHAGACAELTVALALWRGPVLADLAALEFVAAFSSRLEQLHLDAAEARLDAMLGLGRHAEVATEVGELVAQNPLRERLRALHMLALVRCGRQAEALAAFTDLRRTLVEELGIEPSQQLRELHARTLAQDPTLGFTPPAVARAISVDPRARPAVDRVSTSPANGHPARSTSHVALVRLPAQRSSFVGRGAELTEGLELLSRSRLLTLTGPGGTGKTRLAIELAAAAADNFPDGVTYVPLAPVSDPGLVGDSIAQALGLPRDGRRPIDDLIADHLGGKKALLVLDNFEHLVSGATSIGRLLDAAAELRVIVTSRTRLRLYGEQQLQVPPLPLPSSGLITPAAAAATSSAVRLFVERARLLRPRFELDRANAGAVAALCTRLDGLPLAIELAAARTQVLSVGVIMARLNDSLALLSDGPRDHPDRLRSLHATITWSYDLLSEPTRAVFQRLSVFRGGASLEVAQNVCSSRRDALERKVVDDVSEAVTELVSHSLLQREPADGARYTMLETIRDYAAAALSAAGDCDHIRQRHATAFLELAERAAPWLGRRDSHVMLQELELEQHNMRAGLAWFIERDQPALAMRLASALWRYWQMRGHLIEAQQYIDQVLAMPGTIDVDRRLWLETIEAAGGIAYWRGDVARAERTYRDALRTSREIADSAWIARSLSNLAYALRGVDNADEALTTAEEALACFAALGDRSGEAGAMRLIAILGAAAGDLNRAEARAADAQALFEALDQPFDLAWTLRQVGMIELRKGNPSRARHVLSEALRLFTELQDASSVPVIIADLASVARADGDADEASRLSQTSRSLQAATGAEWARIVDRLEHREQAPHDDQGAT